MDVYFVRHGETECNRKHIHQAPITPLSPKGREQAITAGEYLRAMNPDVLITSDYTRTKQTAKLIGSSLGLIPIENTLFHEVRRPAKLYGQSHHGIGTLWYVIKSVLHRKDSAWHYDDAENFSDIRARIHDALKHIEKLKKKNKSVVVVSHTILINLLVAYMCNNNSLELRKLLPYLLHVVSMKNGAVVHVKYVEDHEKGTCPWVVVK